MKPVLVNYGASKVSRKQKRGTYSTREIEKFIFEGGAAGEAQKAIAAGDKAASAAVSAGAAMAYSASVATAATTKGASAVAAKALTAAGASTSVPVAGWIVAGVLIAAAGGIAVAARRASRFLAKDPRILERYIRRYGRKSEDWRTRYAKKQISKIIFELDRAKRKGKMGLFAQKRKAKAELKLEALYFLYKKEGNRGKKASRAAQERRAFELLQAGRTNALIAYPIYFALAGIAAYSIASIYYLEKK